MREFWKSAKTRAPNNMSLLSLLLMRDSNAIDMWGSQGRRVLKNFPRCFLDSATVESYWYNLWSNQTHVLRKVLCHHIMLLPGQFPSQTIPSLLFPLPTENAWRLLWFFQLERIDPFLEVSVCLYILHSLMSAWGDTEKLDKDNIAC